MESTYKPTNFTDKMIIETIENSNKIDLFVKTNLYAEYIINKIF